MKRCTTHPALRALGLLLLLLAINVSAVEVSITASTTAMAAKEEGLVTGGFIISRGGADVSGDLAVNWTIGGATTATAGVDFETDPLSSPVTIPAGQSSVILRLVPLQDALREGEEIVSIRLTTGAYDLGGNQTAQMAIADNDMVISMAEFDGLAYEDFTTGISPTQDPDANRRGVLRVNLDQPMGQVFLLNTVVSPLATRSATLGTDYTLTDKIGGNGMGAGLGYRVQPRYAYVPSAYIAGQVITVTVIFTSDVTVTGTPSLRMETGDNDTVAAFVSHRPANTFAFSYTVHPTDLTADRDYQSVNALTITGGTITSADAPFATARLVLPNPGTVGSLSHSKGIHDRRRQQRWQTRARRDQQRFRWWLWPRFRVRGPGGLVHARRIGAQRPAHPRLVRVHTI